MEKILGIDRHISEYSKKMSTFDVTNVTSKLEKILADPKPNTCREDKIYNAGFDDALEIALDMINQEAIRCNCQ